MAEQNKAVAQVLLLDILGEGRLALVDEVFTSDVLVHGPVYSGPLQPLRSREDIKQHVTTNRVGFPDLNHTIHDQVADGDKVATYFTVSGTHTGEFSASLRAAGAWGFPGSTSTPSGTG